MFLSGFKSAETKILSVVPQGSIFAFLNLSYNSYADDTRLSSDDLSPISKLVNCVL